MAVNVVCLSLVPSLSSAKVRNSFPDMRELLRVPLTGMNHLQCACSFDEQKCSNKSHWNEQCRICSWVSWGYRSPGNFCLYQLNKVWNVAAGLQRREQPLWRSLCWGWGRLVGSKGVQVWNKRRRESRNGGGWKSAFSFSWVFETVGSYQFLQKWENSLNAHCTASKDVRKACNLADGRFKYLWERDQMLLFIFPHLYYL